MKKISRFVIICWSKCQDIQKNNLYFYKLTLEIIQIIMYNKEKNMEAYYGSKQKSRKLC